MIIYTFLFPITTEAVNKRSNIQGRLKVEHNTL